MITHNFVRTVDRAVLFAAAIALVAMMLLVSADVIAKLVFNTPLPLTSALVTEYCMVAVAFLPLAAGEYRRAHIHVDIFVQRLPQAARSTIEILGMALSAAVFTLLAMQAWQQSLDKLSNHAFLMEQSVRLTVWPAYFFLPLGLGLMAALIALNIVCRVLGRAEPVPQGTAVSDPALNEPA